MLTPAFDRLCENCKNARIPEIRHVKKGAKRWTIYTCRICKRQDIEERQPNKVWNPNGSFFEDRYDDTDETTID